MNAQAQSVSVSCTMLTNTQKQGILRCDADGYYPLVLGAYGMRNSVGDVYDIPSAMNFFRKGSPLMRRMEKGVLRAEYKHPKKEDGMNHMQWLDRLREIDADRVCAHIRKVTVDPQGRDERGQPICLVIGEVRPSGPYGDVLKDALENKHENVYFSVRSLTKNDTYRGVRYTVELITWDFVTEGGISVAHKYNSPALEDYTDNAQCIEVIEETVLPADLWRMARHQAAANEEGLESYGMDVRALMKDLGWEQPSVPKASKSFIRSW